MEVVERLDAGPHVRFGEVKVEDGARIRAGAAVPDVKISRVAQEAGIAGLAFFRGIPGAVGGAPGAQIDALDHEEIVGGLDRLDELPEAAVAARQRDHNAEPLERAPGIGDGEKRRGARAAPRRRSRRDGTTPRPRPLVRPPRPISTNSPQA